MNFLFSVKKGYVELAAGTRFLRPSVLAAAGQTSSVAADFGSVFERAKLTLTGGQDVSTQVAKSDGRVMSGKYIGVHMRYSDSVFGSQLLPDAASSGIKNAVECARNVGAKIFGAGDDEWYIYFATNSLGARKYALEMGEPRIFAAPMEPVHIDHDIRRGRDVLWGSWGDEIMLGRSAGIVLDASRYETPAGIGMSGFTAAAMQTNFVPADHVFANVGEHFHCVDLATVWAT